MKPLRIAVVGAGHMGRAHARKVVELACSGGEVCLAGVTDLDPGRAAALGSELGAPAARDARALYAQADAAVVAVPTVSHFEVARAALESGLHLLIEKPIAATLDEAEALVALARQHGRVLQVGHQEWFNGAMRVVRERIDRPRFAEIHRMGPFPERGTDVDVVRDLMIHDIEILQQLLGAEPERVDAVGVPVLTDHVDIANARLGFAECVANLTASRVSATPMRKFRLFQRDAYFSIDFLERRATLFRRLPSEGAAPRIEVEELKTDSEDALIAQLEVFAASARRGPDAQASLRGVSGEAAVAALRTALRVIAAMPAVDGLA